MVEPIEAITCEGNDILNLLKENKCHAVMRLNFARCEECVLLIGCLKKVKLTIFISLPFHLDDIDQLIGPQLDTPKRLKESRTLRIIKIIFTLNISSYTLGHYQYNWPVLFIILSAVLTMKIYTLYF